MAHLVETSEEDSWLAVASYIGDLIDGDLVRRPHEHLKVLNSAYRTAIIANELVANIKTYVVVVMLAAG